MNALERCFRRRLAWYPRRWREAHGAALLGTLLDAAEHEGRTAPTPRETASIVLHGLAARLDPRAAVALAATGTALLLLAALASLAWSPADIAGAATGIRMLLGPALLALALVAVLQRSGVLGPLRTLAVAALGVVALAGGFAAAAGWSAAFDAADAGLPVPPFVQAAEFGGLAVGWSSGAAAIALAVAGALGSALPAPGRIAVASAAGLAGALAVGLALLAPQAGVIAAVAILLLAIAAARRPAAPTGSEPKTGSAPESAPESAPGSVPASASAATPDPRRPDGVRRTPDGARRTTAVALVLAAAAAAGGILTALFAFTGSNWGIGDLDATEAMGAGIAAGGLCLVPLVAALALAGTPRAAANRPGPRRIGIAACLALGPLVLATTVFAFQAADPAVRWYATLAAAVPLGIALALAVAPVLPGSPSIRGWSAVVIGVAAIVVAGAPAVLLGGLLAGPLALAACVVLARRLRRADARPRRLPAAPERPAPIA